MPQCNQPGVREGAWGAKTMKNGAVLLIVAALLILVVATLEHIGCLAARLRCRLHLRSARLPRLPRVTGGHLRTPIQTA